MSGLLSSIGAGAAVESAITSGPLGAILFGATGPVVIGNVVLQSFEVPASITWGGAQRLIVHKMPGGNRQIDAMGEDPMPISWTGRMLGFDRDSRAQQFDAMRKAGQPVPLQWGSHLYTVVVSRFQGADASDQITYQISCEVVQDQSSSFDAGPPGLLGQLLDDVNAALDIYAQVIDLTALGQAIFSGVGKVQSTIEQSGTLTAGDANSAAVAASIAATQALCASAIATAEQPTVLINEIAAGNGFLFGTTDPVQGVSNVVNVTNQSGAQAGALMVAGMLGRMSDNLAAVNGATEAAAFLATPAPPAQALGGNAGQTLVTSGGNLFAIAAHHLGDATQWYRVAQASGLSDYMLNGLTTITIPDAIQAPSAGIPATAGVTIL